MHVERSKQLPLTIAIRLPRTPRRLRHGDETAPGLVHVNLVTGWNDLEKVFDGIGTGRAMSN